jgi:hypothetical protein
MIPFHRPQLGLYMAAATLFLAAPPAAHAQNAADAGRIIAQEAAAYFGGLCVATRGDPGKINATLEAQNLKGMQLSDEGVAAMLGGDPGDLGWLVQTNREVGVKLHVKPPTTCEISTIDLDDAALQETIETVLETLSQREGFTYEKGMDDRRETNGGEQHVLGYWIRWSEGANGKVVVSHIEGDGNDIPRQAQLTLTLEERS